MLGVLPAVLTIFEFRDPSTQLPHFVNKRTDVALGMRQEFPAHVGDVPAHASVEPFHHGIEVTARTSR